MHREKAREFCKQLADGGDLVALESADEESFVVETVMSGRVETVWTGCNRINACETGSTCAKNDWVWASTGKTCARYESMTAVSAQGEDAVLECFASRQVKVTAAHMQCGGGEHSHAAYTARVQQVCSSSSTLGRCVVGYNGGGRTCPSCTNVRLDDPCPGEDLSLHVTYQCHDAFYSSWFLNDNNPDENCAGLYAPYFGAHVVAGGDTATTERWVASEPGVNCDSTCTTARGVCTAESIERQSTLTTYEAASAAWSAAGFPCSGQHGCTDYNGSPFQRTEEFGLDCGILCAGGKKSVCKGAIPYPHHRAICWCEGVEPLPPPAVAVRRWDAADCEADIRNYICEAPVRTRAQWHVRGASKYKIVTEHVTWDAARMSCEALAPGGHLAVFESAEEEAFVTRQVQETVAVKEAAVEPNGSSDWYWFGCSRKAASTVNSEVFVDGSSSGDFRWIKLAPSAIASNSGSSGSGRSCSRSKARHSAWTSGDGMKDACAINTGNYWQSVPCNYASASAYVCEVPSGPEWKVRGHAMYAFYQGGGGGEDWVGARAACRSLGLHVDLVDIRDEKEAQFVAREAAAAAAGAGAGAAESTRAAVGTARIWLGFNNANGEGVFTWSGSEQVVCGGKTTGRDIIWGDKDYDNVELASVVADPNECERMCSAFATQHKIEGACMQYGARCDFARGGRICDASQGDTCTSTP